MKVETKAKFKANRKQLIGYLEMADKLLGSEELPFSISQNELYTRSMDSCQIAMLESQMPIEGLVGLQGFVFKIDAGELVKLLKMLDDKDVVIAIVLKTTGVLKTDGTVDDKKTDSSERLEVRAKNITLSQTCLYRDIGWNGFPKTPKLEKGESFQVEGLKKVLKIALAISSHASLQITPPPKAEGFNEPKFEIFANGSENDFQYSQYVSQDPETLPLVESKQRAMFPLEYLKNFATDETMTITLKNEAPIVMKRKNSTFWCAPRIEYV